MNHCKLILKYELGIMKEKWRLHKIKKVKTQLKMEKSSEETTSGNGETVEETYEKYIMT